MLEHVTRPRTAGLVCAAAGLALTASAIATQALRTGSDMPDDLWRFPFSADVFVAVTLAWAVAQTGLLVGALAFARSGAAAAATFGTRLAVAGTAIIVVAHPASLPFTEQRVDDAGPLAVSVLFALGSVAAAAGFLLAGRAALRDGVWRSWRRRVPLALGIASLAPLVLAPTALLPLGVAAYSAAFAVLGIALARPGAARPIDRPAAVRVGNP